MASSGMCGANLMLVPLHLSSYQYMWMTLIVTQRMQIPNREQKDMIFWLTVFSEAARSSVLAHVESIAVFLCSGSFSRVYVHLNCTVSL